MSDSAATATTKRKPSAARRAIGRLEVALEKLAPEDQEGVLAIVKRDDATLDAIMACLRVARGLCEHDRARVADFMDTAQ